VAARLLGFLRSVSVPPFVVFALPRSRTAWLARYLTYGGWECGHDEIRHCRSLDDVRAWLGQPGVGSVETAAGPFWRLLRALRSDARVVVVRRPVDDVTASLMGLGLGCFDPAVVSAAMHRLDRKLEQIERRVPGVLSVAYADLDDEATCGRIFEHCLGLPHDHAWWAAVSAVNIQINMAHCIRYYHAHAPQLKKLAELAAHRIRADMRPVEREFDGMTFHVEPFSDFVRDAEALITDHAALVGRKAGLDFNVPLFQGLDDIGALQVMTARSNGRCFGYLVSIVAPSLDGPDIREGHHTMFYTAPEVRGLGVRLLMRANDALRERGCAAILMRAGVVGSGPTLGAVYRRLGAEQFGELYRLSLEA
jgi:GNAT superfamily N-acetyltransferase